MGNQCCTAYLTDSRPQMKITIGTAENLPRLDAKESEDTEIQAFVRLRYGPLNNSRNDIVKDSVIIKTKKLSATWNQILYIPIPSLKAHYSLEVSVWDKDYLNNDDYAGRGIIHYSDSGGNRESIKFNEKESKNLLEKKHIKDYLPKEWNKEKSYSLELEQLDKNTNKWSTGGNITLTVEFIKPNGMQADINTDEKDFGAMG